MTVRRQVGPRRPRLLPHSQLESTRPVTARNVLFLSAALTSWASEAEVMPASGRCWTGSDGETATGDDYGQP